MVAMARFYMWMPWSQYSFWRAFRDGKQAAQHGQPAPEDVDHSELYLGQLEMFASKLGQKIGNRWSKRDHKFRRHRDNLETQYESSTQEYAEFLRHHETQRFDGWPHVTRWVYRLLGPLL